MQIDFLKNSVKGFLASVLLIILLLLGLGYVCYMSEDPSAPMGWMGKTILFVSALVGGFIAAKFNKGMGLVSGAATGGMLMLVVMLLSLMMSEGGISLGGWLSYLLIPVVAAAGGYAAQNLGKNGKRRKKYSRKRR